MGQMLIVAICLLTGIAVAALRHRAARAATLRSSKDRTIR
jgi:hypothetical protein